MKIVPRAAVLGAVVSVLGLTGCDRVSALFKHGDNAPADTTAGGASAVPGSTTAGGDVPAFSGFEGEIGLAARAKSSPAPATVNLLVKNDRVRFELPPEVLASPQAQAMTGGGKVYGVLRSAEKQVTFVLDGKREAVVVNLDGLADRMKALRPTVPGAPPPPPAEPPTVTKTGKKDTVAGFPCEEWDVKNQDRSEARLCVASTGATFFKLPLTGVPTEHAWALELLDGQHFPMRALAIDKDGGEVGRVEVTKLDKHAVDAALFEVPAGYKQMTLDEFLAGLSGAPPVPDTPPDPPSPKPHKGHGGHHHKNH